MAGNPNFPISTAAISWIDGNGNTMIRVYSCDGYNVIERAWDGSGWSTGSFSQPGSAVSATCQNRSGTVWIRVYCTYQDKTTEWCCDDGATWYQGAFTTT